MAWNPDWSRRCPSSHEVSWTEHTKLLQPLIIGDSVRIQNQTGAYPNSWNKTKVMIEEWQSDPYVVNVYRSGRGNSLQYNLDIHSWQLWWPSFLQASSGSSTDYQWHFAATSSHATSATTCDCWAQCCTQWSRTTTHRTANTTPPTTTTLPQPPHSPPETLVSPVHLLSVVQHVPLIGKKIWNVI